ncbi:MAG: DUF362 domain-containing protein [Planctomycetes bacterium]|nr:DUF362 domain-containing protein [Planctomycetota bacterium]
MKSKSENKSPNPEEASNLDRRTFFRRLTVDATLAAGLVAGGLLMKGDRLPLEREEIDHREPDAKTVQENNAAPITKRSGPAILAVVRHEQPGVATKLALETLGGMENFISPGDRVLIKPNIGWDRRPNLAANTNPEVVAVLAERCLAAGAAKVVVTDSPCNNPARCFDKSGIKAALESMNVEVLIPTDRDYVEKDLGGEVLKIWPVLKVLLESDKIINVPIAKHHSSAILSLGMKNWYGILGGGKKRGQLHQAMARGIAELAEFVRPHLTVLDASRILFRNGPQGGSISDTKVLNTVVASMDPVAVDAYGAGFFDLTPGEVPYIPMAEAKQLGTADLDVLDLREVGG